MLQLGEVYNGDGTGKCTICGGGSDSLLHVYNPLACRAPNRECDGFSYNGTIGRNLVHRCTSEGSCCPGVVVADSEPQPGPDVDHNYCNFQVGASLPPIALVLDGVSIMFLRS